MESILRILGIIYFGWNVILWLYGIGYGIWELLKGDGDFERGVLALFVAPLGLWLSLYFIWQFKTGNIWSTNIAWCILGVYIIFTLLFRD